MIESLDLCLAHHANSPGLVGARVELWHDGMQMRTSASTPLICCGYL
jgi:hypothetical protein